MARRAAAALAAACGAAATGPPEGCQDIVALAGSTPDLSTLAVAITTDVDLAEILQTSGPLTMFAPTNDAFAALPKGALHLFDTGNAKDLDKILEYHVLDAMRKVVSADFKDGEIARTLEGKNVTFHTGADGVTVNGASIVRADVPACNGVLHVIDAVLLPDGCGASCKTGADCDEVSQCNLCIPVRGSNSSFVCGAGCSMPCTADSQCATEGCNKCVHGACAPHSLSTCGGPCNDEAHDCDNTTECGFCAPVHGQTDTYACSAGCGAACSADDQCRHYLCAKCVGGKCDAQPAPPGPPAPPLPFSGCGGPCSEGKHNCDGSTECGLCIPLNGSNTSFVCGAGCGGNCSSDSVCTEQGCGHCVQGACKPRALSSCGGPCNDGDNDCDKSTDCDLCIPDASNTTYKCGAGCGGPCASDAECGAPRCGSCANGTCTARRV